jgi:cyclopropane-fatty-acyl-phospholipid synthase
MTLVERIVVWVMLRTVHDGSLVLTLPSGTTTMVGKGEPRADVTISDGSVLPSILRHGATGFAEAYMEGKLETTDIATLLRWGAANHDGWFTSPLGRVLTPLRKLWLRIRPERRHPRVQSMVDHYNLGNDFYASWLDPTLTYSSARFTHPDQPLEDAQRHKYETIARHVGLGPGMTVLEIGCGWGGFAEYAAGELGCAVVGLTIAEEQARFARKRIAGRGLTDLVDIRLQDFREVEGTFDAVVSIEMIESIDESQWPDLFATISRSLGSGARAAMQAITIADPLWEQYRAQPDFIQQYIFPGGQLPAPKILNSLAVGTGLEVEQIETFGLDYARTLAHWHGRFTAIWPTLAGNDGLDDRFRRMWDLYLTLCEAGFRSGRVNVEQWVFASAETG